MRTNLSKRMSVVTGFVIFFGVLNILLLLAKAENAVGIWSNPLGKWNEEWYATYSRRVCYLWPYKKHTHHGVYAQLHQANQMRRVFLKA